MCIEDGVTNVGPESCDGMDQAVLDVFFSFLSTQPYLVFVSLFDIWKVLEELIWDVTYFQ